MTTSRRLPAQAGQPLVTRPANDGTPEAFGVAADRLTLLACLARWERRRRLTALVIAVPRGLMAGALGCLILAAITRLCPVLLLDQQVMISVGLLIAGAVLAALIVSLWPRATMTAARFYDQRFAASERISTALELADPTHPRYSSPLTLLQVRDARRYAEAIDPRARLPLRWQRRDLIVTGGLIVLVLAALLAPNPQIGLLNAQQATQTAINQQIAGLTQIANAAQNNPALTDPQKAAIANTAQNAIKVLSQPGVSAIEASAILSQAAQQFQAIPKSNPSPVSASNGASSPQQAADQRAGDALSKASQGSPSALSADMAQLGAALQKGDLAAASTAASDLAHTIGNSARSTPSIAATKNSASSGSATAAPADGTASPGTSSANAAAQAFSQASSALSATDPKTAQAFQDAAQALTANDSTTAQQALIQAAQSLQQAPQPGSATPQATASAPAQAAIDQAAQSAAQQAAQGAQQVAQTDASTSGHSSPSANSGDQTGTNGQAGTTGSNPSGNNPADNSAGSQGADGGSGGNPGKSGGSQFVPGQSGEQPSGTNPQLIAQNGQSVGQNPGSHVNSGGSAGPAEAGQGSGGAGSDITGGTGSTGTSGSSGTHNQTPAAPSAGTNGSGGITTANESVYAPSFINGSGGQAVAIPNSANSNPLAPGVNQNNVNNPQPANATVPLDTVIASAAAQSSQAMDAAHVPISLRGVIHDYFSGLQNMASQASVPTQPVSQATPATP